MNDTDLSSLIWFPISFGQACAQTDPFFPFQLLIISLAHMTQAINIVWGGLDRENQRCVPGQEERKTNHSDPMKL